MAIAELLKINSSLGMSNFSPEVWRVFDYMGGAILILYFLLSTILNPIVFYHYWKLPSTIPNILYRILAISDLMTNLVRPIVMVLAHFNSEKLTEVLQEDMTASRIITVQVRMSMTMSFASVALLALTRAMKIQWPFVHIKRRLIFVWLGIFAIFEFVVVTWNMAGGKRHIKRFVCVGSSVALIKETSEEGGEDLKLSKLTELSAAPMYLHAVIAVIVTIWAVVALARAIQQSKVTKMSGDQSSGEQTSAFQRIREKFKGCTAIIIINLTSLVMVVNMIIYAVQNHLKTKYGDGDGRISLCHSAYTVNMIIPSLIAATNPVILIKFNEDLGRRVAFWRNDGRSQRQQALTPSTRQTTQVSPQTAERTHHSVDTGQV